MNVVMHPRFTIGADAILRDLDSGMDALVAAFVLQIRSMANLPDLQFLIGLANTIASTWENVRAAAPFSEKGRFLRQTFNILIQTTANAINGYASYINAPD